ncbi:MAG: hypothetical protein AB1512_13520 [Thermodesulfobacteriota bacterium]
MNTAKTEKSEHSIYGRQNRAIHAARMQLFMDLDDCRELARSINGKPSLSGLSLRQRWELIEVLKGKGARVLNPSLREIRESNEINPKDVYPAKLAYWEKRFPNRRPGYASNKELAWIETLFELDFNDGRAGSATQGLRGFIYRQTMNLVGGPVSDLSFLKINHVRAVLAPLRKKARERRNSGDERRHMR